MIAPAAQASVAPALRAARLLAADPHALCGAVFRGPPGPEREAFLAALAAALPAGAPVRRLPPGVEDDRLHGGLDLAATLAAGRPVHRAGLLAEADGGVIVVPMAERLSPDLAARLAQALDRGDVTGADGTPRPARFGLVLLDEGGDGESAPAMLLDRLAFHLTARDLSAQAGEGVQSPQSVADPAALLCETAERLGIAQVRAISAALHAARLAAASNGRDAPDCSDLAEAAALVLGPRATVVPSGPEAVDPPGPLPDAGRSGAASSAAEQLVQAVAARVPPDVLTVAAGRAGRGAGRSAGEGTRRRAETSGRRAGSRPGTPGRGARLDLIETLKAAAPWQAVRRRERPHRAGLQIRRSDFRVRRFVRRERATAIFVVDASGSAAAARLAEAKGAVELLLARAYVRRDEVAVIGFRGEAAGLLLPPTRSLARARRELADMPGGGGTPLAAAIAAATGTALAARARGTTPLVVFLTDGRGNVARVPGEDPTADASAAARAFGAGGFEAVLIDTGRRPRAEPAALAAALGARYVPLPARDPAAIVAALDP